MSQFALKTRLPRYLRMEQERVEGVARSLGLDFFPVVFEMVKYHQMDELASYGGFPTRYPHWRFGMEYERLSKSAEYGLSRIYEMVINNTPSYAYLMEGNSLTDQRLVMAHVYAHVDFFKNNFCFRATDLDAVGRFIDPSRRDPGYSPNRRWIDKMANHGSRVSRQIARHGIDKVESFIDHALSLENLIDPWLPFRGKAKPKPENGEDEAPVEIPRLAAKDYMDPYINPEEYIEAQRKKLDEAREQEKKFPPEPVRDVMEFIIEHAPLDRWERDVLSIVRAEAYYFVPQMQTKIMNEGWACVAGDSLVATDGGMITMAELVAGDAARVSDGEREQAVYDRNVIRNHETVTVRTRRGLRLCGSTNHRVRLADGSWRRLDEVEVGERVEVARGHGLWSASNVALDWQEQRRVTLNDVAAAAGVSLATVARHRAGKRTRAAAAIRRSLGEHEGAANAAIPRSRNKRRSVRIPSETTRELGSLLGYLVGDGHVSRVKRHFGLTTGDHDQAMAFADLAHQLFGLMSRVRLDGNRWRVLVHSETASDFLTEGCGLTWGPSARDKTIPNVILRSTEDVVRHFLRAYFDCDAYAGKQGIILSTASEKMSQQVQIVLLNFGILNRRRQQKDGCWHVHITGASVLTFVEMIGFGLARKKEQVERYLADRRWLKRQTWDDEIVAIEHGREDVYDISVQDTHRYAAQGLINHNSFWHSKMMTEHILDCSEIIDYADRNAGVMATSPGQLNPYKLGVELYRHIEERWNKGRFGKEWDECENLEHKRTWDMQLGLGRKKIFQVRALYNDVTFIDEFLTPEFVIEQKLYTFGYSGKSGQFEIESRQFEEVKQKLLFQLTNFGNPIIEVVDANFQNRGELLLLHDHQGVDLDKAYSEAALEALVRCWKRPVSVATKIDKKDMLLRYDGEEHSEQPYTV